MPRRNGPSAENAASLTPRLAWVTDPHFDHAKLDVWRQWADDVIRDRPDALILTGDLSEGDDVAYQLRCLAQTFERPIYFVLGNHDFYGGTIAQTRRRIIELSHEVDQLHYLTDLGPVPLSPGCVLVGDDGWGDATEGDYENSNVRLNDFVLIEDFQEMPPATWKAALQREGREAAERLRSKLSSLPESITDVLIATHVPPFREACWYEGKTTDENWAPFFVCGQVGRMLRSVACEFPKRRFTVLCGHTHHDGDADVLPNLVVHTGFSRYGTLDVESMIEITPSGFVVPRMTAN